MGSIYSLQKLISQIVKVSPISSTQSSLGKARSTLHRLFPIISFTKLLLGGEGKPQNFPFYVKLETFKIATQHSALWKSLFSMHPPFQLPTGEFGFKTNLNDGKLLLKKSIFHNKIFQMDLLLIK